MQKLDVLQDEIDSDTTDYGKSHITEMIETFEQFKRRKRPMMMSAKKTTLFVSANTKLPVFLEHTMRQ